MARRKKIKTVVPKKPKYKRVYKVSLIGNNVEKKTYGTFKTEKEAYDKFNEILEQCKNVAIPVEYNTKTVVKKMKYELIILKTKTPIDTEDIKFRNDYGEFVKYEVNSSKWVLHDKAPFYKEEKFWVYGYNSKSDRKNCYWIYDEFIKNKANSHENMLNIYVYYNKLLFDTTTDFNMVLCKTKSDCIRLYNYLEERFKSDKTVKHALFSGKVTTSTKRKEMCIDKIRKLTNWKDYKIFRYSTRRNTTDYVNYVKKTKPKHDK